MTMPAQDMAEQAGSDADHRWLWIGGGLVLSVLILLQAAALVMADTGSRHLLNALGTADAPVLADWSQDAAAGKDADAAIDLGRMAVARGPLHQPAVRALGIARQIAGQKEEGAAILRAAGTLGWRDGLTQLWLMQDAFVRADINEGVRRADALALRLGMGPEVFNLFILVANEPGLQGKLARRLAMNPPWRRDFFRNARLAEAKQLGALATLIDGLRSSSFPPTREEIVAVEAALVDKGQFAVAHRLFQNRRFDEEKNKASRLVTGTGGRAMTTASIVTDGGFDLGDAYDNPEFRPSPFDWQLGFGRGRHARVDRNDDGNHVLFVRGGGGARGIFAAQMMVIPPGPHIFRYRVVDTNNEMSSGFAWHLICISAEGKRGRTLLESNVARTGQYAVSFTMPAGECAGAVLQLTAKRLPSRQTIKTVLDGVSID